jgi:hypothetical protein
MSGFLWRVFHGVTLPVKISADQMRARAKTVLFRCPPYYAHRAGFDNKGLSLAAQNSLQISRFDGMIKPMTNADVFEPTIGFASRTPVFPGNTAPA